MSRAPARKHADRVDALARLLRDCYLAAYVAHNPNHSDPAWGRTNLASPKVAHGLAAELLARKAKVIELCNDD